MVIYPVYVKLSDRNLALNVGRTQSGHGFDLLVESRNSQSCLANCFKTGSAQKSSLSVEFVLFSCPSSKYLPRDLRFPPSGKKKKEKKSNPLEHFRKL